MSSFAPYAQQHASPNGPDDARPTALQIVKDQELEGKLQGRSFVVTGSSGLGLEIAKALHATGADVVMTGRDIEKGHAVAEQIAADNKPGKVAFVQLELDSLESVRVGAQEILKQTDGKINTLILNAGVMMCPETKTVDGFEMQFGTNHLGHFALFQHLKDALLSSASSEFASRLVIVTSGGHRFAPLDMDDYNLTKGYNPMIAYSHAKTANIYMSNEVERRFGGQHLHANAVHPGLINTGIARHLDAATLQAFTTFPGAKTESKSPGQGAATTVLAAVAKELEGKGGFYLEECQIASQADSPDLMACPRGYAPWAFNEANEKKLWEDSMKLIGM